MHCVQLVLLLWVQVVSLWCFLLTHVGLGLSCQFLTIELITLPTYLGSPLRDTSMAGSWR